MQPVFGSTTLALCSANAEDDANLDIHATMFWKTALDAFSMYEYSFLTLTLLAD